MKRYLQYNSWQELHHMVRDYQNVYVILTTRDSTIGLTSAVKRFGDHGRSSIANIHKAHALLQGIADRAENVFIWNYETALILSDVYAKQLYKFINLPSCNFSVEHRMFDGNTKYTNIKGKNTSHTG